MPVLIYSSTALTGVVVCVVLVRRHRCLRRALVTERAARRLTEAAHYRDMAAFSERLHAAVYAREVLDEADLILDSALASHRHDPEGGSA